MAWYLLLLCRVISNGILILFVISDFVKFGVAVVAVPVYFYA